MSQAEVGPTGKTRGVGAVAAYAGGALTAAGALGVGVLVGQVLIARLTIPGAEAPPPRCDGDYGGGHGGYGEDFCGDEVQWRWHCAAGFFG